jgi:hypothetical protein
MLLLVKIMLDPYFDRQEVVEVEMLQVVEVEQ